MNSEGILRELHEPRSAKKLQAVLQAHREQANEYTHYSDPNHGSLVPLQSILMNAKKEELLNILSVYLVNMNVRVDFHVVGSPPLHMAIANNHTIDVIKLLIAFGADINLSNKDQNNETPLDVARRCNHQPALSLLSDLHAFSSKSETFVRHRSGHLAAFSDTELPEKYNTTNFSAAGTESVVPYDIPDLFKVQFDHYKEKIDMQSMSRGYIEDPAPLMMQQFEIDRFTKTRGNLLPDVMERGGNRILFLDGGGIRGLMQIEMLLKLQRMTGKPVTDMFDFIVGTSTGGILALGLVYAQKSLEDMRHIYFQLKEQVLKGKGIIANYLGFCDSQRLEEIFIDELFGTEMRMTDKLHPKVLISAVDKRKNPTKLRFFNNCFFGKDDFDHPVDDTPVWKVARYTSAAPTYFTECDEYVDGGLMANNPSQEGLKVIRDFYPNIQIALVVSLGTGKFKEENIEEADIITCLKSFRIREAASGLKHLMESTMQAITTDGPNETTAFVCRQLHVPYFRFNPNLHEKVDLKEVRTDKLVTLILETKMYCNEMEVRDQLAHLVQLLHAAVRVSHSEAMYRSTVSDNSPMK